MKDRTQEHNKPASLQIAVCISWASHFVQITSGFIIPRLMLDQLGIEVLGIWTLGWSLVSYFMLLEAGIGSSVNRHVAMHRAESDLSSINRVVSTVAVAQRAVGTLIIGGAIAISFFVDYLAKDLRPADFHQAQWVVIILGSSIGISLYGGVYSGVLTGCQKWKLQHSIYAFTNILSFIGMATVLALGKGVIAIAIVHLSTEILGRIIRTIAAYRFCPGLSNRIRHANVNTLKQMLSFGGKIYLTRMSQIVMNQTVNVMISSFLGLGVIPLYAQPRSLVRQAAVFSQKYSLMLVPKAATLSNQKDKDKAALAIESTRNGMFIALPFSILLAISGHNLLSIWLGIEFSNPLLMAILSIGFLSEIVYQPLNSILAGLNLHGKPAAASTIGAVTSIAAVGLLLIAKQNNLSHLALAVTIPWSILHGIYIPFYACTKLNLPIRLFILESWIRPLLSITPFAACLLSANLFFPDSPLKALLAGGISGGSFLVFTYWKWALPTETRNNILRKFGHKPRLVQAR